MTEVNFEYKLGDAWVTVKLAPGSSFVIENKGETTKSVGQSFETRAGEYGFHPVSSDICWNPSKYMDDTNKAAEEIRKQAEGERIRKHEEACHGPSKDADERIVLEELERRRKSRELDQTALDKERLF